MTDDDLGVQDAELRDLRLLDPAHPPRPSAGRDEPAQALLARILEKPRVSEAPSGRTGAGSRRGRWVLVGAAAAAVAVGEVLMPPWGAPDHAFASWTPVPEEVPATVEDEIAAQCSNELAMDRLDQEVVLAEERGRVTFGLLARPGYLRHCLLADGMPVLSGSGSTGPAGGDAELAPAEVRTVMATGGGSGAEAYTTVTGRAGQDVVGVEVHPRGPVEAPGELPGGRLPDTVTATVENGYFAAWWPGISVRDLELTVHLADGTVLADVPAFDDGR